MLKSPATSTDRAAHGVDLFTEAPSADTPTGQRRGPYRSPYEPAPVTAGQHPSARTTETDAITGAIADEVLADPEAFGLVLHGSRASGLASADSNYDFLILLGEDAYERRSQRGTTVERRFRAGSPTVEISYEGVERFRRAASQSRYGAALAVATVLVDKIGEIESLLKALRAPRAPVRGSVIEDYDSYLHGFAHSLKAWSRGDDLGARAHAAQSALKLVGALFGLEGKPPPYLDQLSTRLAELDAPQGWRPGFLSGALVRLLYAPDPPHQQMLERRVRRLMESRGIRHGWRHDLDRLRTISYDDL